MPEGQAPVVVITGASSGIGRATALAFARQGADLVLAARTRANLDAVAALSVGAGARAVVVPTDITDEDQVHRLAAVAVEQFGGLATWVNAAGVSPRLALEETTTEAIEQVMAVNFYGAVHGIRAAVRVMGQSGCGSIVTIGSLTCVRGAPQRAAYSASKHALKGYIEAARVELRRSAPGISLTLVHPGAVASGAAPPAQRHRFAQRAHSADAVAEAVVFAASHSRRDIYVGMGRGLAAIEGVFPSLLDWLYERATAPAVTGETPVGGAGVEARAPEDGRASSIVTRTIEYYPRQSAAVGVASSAALVTVARALRRRGR
jgi:short-subunit dehydrogenase